MKIIYLSVAAMLLMLPSVPRALAAEEVLFADDFSTTDSGWGVATENWNVKDGKLAIIPTLNLAYTALNQSNVFTDADISVEISLAAGETIQAGGLVFWGKDLSDYYILHINGNGSFEIVRRVGGRWLDPVAWTLNEAINKGVGQVNKLRVVTKGRQATAYINDKQVATINGQPPAGGSCIGLSGQSPEKTQNTWQFSNLKVVAIQ